MMILVDKIKLRTQFFDLWRELGELVANDVAVREAIADALALSDNDTARRIIEVLVEMQQVK